MLKALSPSVLFLAVLSQPYFSYAISGNQLVPIEELPTGVCQIAFKDYRFSSITKKIKPTLPHSSCTTAFLTDRILLMARHCYLEEEIFFGNENPQKLKSDKVDILCLKTGELRRNLAIKKIYFPPTSYKPPNRNHIYKDLMAIELVEKFSDKTVPLKVAANLSLESHTELRVFGYGFTDQLTGGILNDLEPFILFDSPIDQRDYNSQLTGIYKGHRMNHYRTVSLSEVLAEFPADADELEGLIEGEKKDRSGYPLAFLKSIFEEHVLIQKDNTPLKGGDSGGPITNASGEIIAVNSFAPYLKDEGIRFAGFSTLITPDLKSWIEGVLATSRVSGAPSPEHSRK